MHYLSLLTIFKNESLNLRVWLDHYLFQGVEHFYLIDNGSDDCPMEVLGDYIEEGLVTYEYMPEKWNQVQHYKTLYDTHKIRDNTQWLMVCDLDEFIFGTQNRLSTFLKTREGFREIHTHWLMFGSDGHVEHPEDIRRSIVYRQPETHPNEKYIFQPALFTNGELMNVHFMTDASRSNRRVPGYIVEDDLIHLNHYPIQSVEYFQKVKMTRGDVNNVYSENVRDMTYFQNYDKDQTFKDELLKNIVENPPENY